MPYINLPGSSVELQDGNLSFFARDLTQSVLVLGTATKGLTSEPFLMTDLSSVIGEFGATSELTRTASEVRKGGARNIYVYRLPGEAPSVSYIGSDVNHGMTEVGITVTPTQESPESAARYAVAYRHVKNVASSGSGSANQRLLTGDLIVVNLDTQSVVWQGSALTGATLDTGEVDVDFELGDICAGESTSVEQLTLTVSGTATADGTITIPISGKTVTVAVLDEDTASAIGNKVRTALDAAFSEFAVTGSSAVATVTANTAVGSTGSLVYSSGHPYAGYDARPFLTAAISVGATGVTVGVSTSSHGVAANIGLYPQNSDAPFASVGGGVFVPLDKIVSGGTVKSYGLRGAEFTSPSATAYASANFDESTRSEFTTGSTGASISAVKRYEKLHTAFENLDLAAFDYVYCAGATLDHANITTGASASVVENIYPVPKSASDVLGYLSTVNNGDYTYTYCWSFDGEEMTLASDGPVSEHDGETHSYKEVNFAYLIAKYCYENSSDYRSVHGVVATSLPTGVSARQIRVYFGSGPVYTLNPEDGTYFIAESEDNGTGLLGHKFVGGKHDFNGGAKHGGFFLTADGSVDYVDSNIVTDDNGKKVDLGKYLTVVAAFGRMTDDINTRRPSYLGSAAPVVCGMLPNVSPIDSLINMTIPGVTIDYRLELKTVDVACGLGLVVAKSENGVPVIADSPTFASPTSDYTRLTTVRIVNRLAEELRTTARPFIGKGLPATKRAALEAALGEVLKRNLAGEPIQTITSGRFEIVQSAQDRVLGKMKIKLTITPVFELRQITFSVSLSST